MCIESKTNRQFKIKFIETYKRFTEYEFVKRFVYILAIVCYWITVIVPISLAITSTFFTCLTLIQGFTLVVNEEREMVIINMSAEILRTTFIIFLVVFSLGSIFAAYWTYNLIREYGIFGIKLPTKGKQLGEIKGRLDKIEDRLSKIESKLGIEPNNENTTIEKNDITCEY